MQMADKIIPVPILCSIVMPEGLVVKALAIGTKIRSYIGMKRKMAKPIKDCREAAGILKPIKSVLSRVAPCLVKKVEDCAYTIAYTKLVAHMGTSLRNSFASSTSLTVQTLPSSL